MLEINQRRKLIFLGEDLEVTSPVVSVKALQANPGRLL